MSFSEYNDATFSSAFYEPDQFANTMMPNQQMNNDYGNENNNMNSFENNRVEEEPMLSQSDENKIKEILNAASENRNSMNMNNNNNNNRNPQITMPPVRMPEANPFLNSNNDVQSKLLNELIEQNKLLKNEINPPPEPEPEQTNKPSLKLMFLSLIIFISFMIALSWNEAIKYYINRSMKLYEGKPVFFIYYGLITTGIGGLIYYLSKKYI